MSTSTAFGIDLGTTNSASAIYRNGRIDMVVDKNGKPIVPSYVCFPASGDPPFIAGFIAKTRMTTRPKEVVHDCKRLIGAKFSDPIVKRMQDSVAFSIVDDGNNKPMISIKQNNKEERRYPEQISAYILSHLKSMTQSFAGFPITDVVITVPARYTQLQRQIVRDAANISGLNAIAIITEPVAAAYAYADLAQDAAEKTILIYDLGGGTFDVTVMHIKGLQFTEVALGGDEFLGGSDFDAIIMKDVIDAYNEEMSGNDDFEEITTRDKGKLRKKCEDAKIDLTSVLSTDITINDDIDWTYTLSRNHMNQLIYNQIKRSIEICDETIAKAGLKPEDIDEIVLVGGSTRLLMVEKELKEHFNLTVKHTVNPDECVAYGAAKYANYLTQHPEILKEEDGKLNEAVTPESPAPQLSETPTPQSSETTTPQPSETPTPQSSETTTPQPSETPTPQPPMVDVGSMTVVPQCPSCIGLQGGDGKMIVLIKAGEKLPFEVTLPITNTKPMMKHIPFRVYQGDKEMCDENSKIKQIRFKVEQPKAAFQNRFQINFKMSVNGNLSLSIKDMDSGKEVKAKDMQATWSAEEMKVLKGVMNEELKKTEEYLKLLDKNNTLQGEAFNLLEQIDDDEKKEELDRVIAKYSQKKVSVEMLQEFEAVVNSYRQYV